MDKQTIYILMAMVAFCILFFLYLIFNHESKIRNEENKDNFNISFKNQFDLIYEKYKIKNYAKKNNQHVTYGRNSNPIVQINGIPKFSEPNENNNLNYTITWKSTNTSIAEYSWIGIYPYGQKNGIFNCLNYFYLNKNLTGIKQLPIPSQAGYYDLRYIQDNNKKALTTQGPFVVNPRDSFIRVINEEIQNDDFNNNIYNNNYRYNDLVDKDANGNLINNNEQKEIENLIDMKMLKNYFKYDKISIEWKIAGNTLENLFNRIFGDRKSSSQKNSHKNINDDEHLSMYLNPHAKFNKNNNKDETNVNDTNTNINKNLFDSNLQKINGNAILAEINSAKISKMKNEKNKNIDNINNAKILNDEIINLNTQNLNVYICLTIIGSLDSKECLWIKKLDNLSELSGKVTLENPKIAGYFYFRIFLERDFDLYESTDYNIVVSDLFKISSGRFILLPDTLNAVVGSSLAISWFSAEPKRGDYIAIYNLADTEAFLESMTPIKSVKIVESNAYFGNFTAFLPTNSEAGQFLFVYFRHHRPISVSDIIEVQQPRVSCPNNRVFMNNIFDINLKSSSLEKLTLNQLTQSNIKHLVIICTENHSFDSYFGNYCESEAGSNPSCNYGSKCCEKPPKTLNGFKPVILNDTQNLAFDPNHNQYCELCEINNGKMNGFVKGCSCSDQRNFAIADEKTVKILFDYAKNYSLADMFFQPNAGASSQNDMYFARASHVFIDNRKIGMGSFGSNCWYSVHFLLNEYEVYYEPTITSLLSHCNFTLRTYAEGYGIAKNNFTGNPCYPLGFDSSDIPFNYYAGVEDKQNFIQDYLHLQDDIKNKTLPEVSFIKPLGIRTAHPGYGNITDELNFVKQTVDMILNDEYYYNNTLILYIPDESGGYYDHIAPPPTSEVDHMPYGPRIPVLAIGKFAKKNYVSHVVMEHSSIIKFIEWNWLSGETGQLNVRDKFVNNIGDLIDSEKAGIVIPS